MSGHTKGPWRAVNGGFGWDGGPIRFTIQKGCILLADWVMSESGTGKENEANAHMIAASPDLLEACEFVDGELAACGFNPAEIIRATLRAAIVKAKGEA
jgi:hypothetical protein